ncbi:MAG: GNAT family N-acetyltransferase, partial [Actinomycetota bacterium]
QGKGFGELLLRWALHYYQQLNRKYVELNVDSGNESGALRLYEKVGFKTKQSWQHFHNPEWANF